MVSLATDRLVLEPLSEEHLDAWHAIWGDPEVIWWGHDENLDASRASLAGLSERIDAMPDGLGWWMLRSAAGDLVGDVVLQPAPDPPGGVEIGWHLARAHQGHGYATEGAAALLPHAWELGLEEVIAMIVPMNAGSVRVAERLGMVRRGSTVMRGNLAHGIWVIERP